jgi:hypothetical protein
VVVEVALVQILKALLDVRLDSKAAHDADAGQVALHVLGQLAERLLHLLGARNIFPEKVRVSSISSGTVVNDTSVIFGEIASMTCSALASANTMLMMFITPNPVSSRIWVRSDVARLMISPADSRR